MFPIWAKRDLFHRFNGLVLGEFEDMQTVGFQTQFTKCYGDVQAHPFVKVKQRYGHESRCACRGEFTRTTFSALIRSGRFWC